MTSSQLHAVIAEGRKPLRLRGVKVPPPKEDVLHIATVKLLSEHCLPDWRWYHPANGEVRNTRTAVKLKRLGVKAGIPDIVLTSPGGMSYFLELKRIGGKLTRDQESFRLWCVKYGVHHAVARTIDDVLVALNEWGCLRPEGFR